MPTAAADMAPAAPVAAHPTVSGPPWILTSPIAGLWLASCMVMPMSGATAEDRFDPLCGPLTTIAAAGVQRLCSRRSEIALACPCKAKGPSLRNHQHPPGFR